jgi:prepilin-type N-terminal cleavage/methylation domain-containing protein
MKQTGFTIIELLVVIGIITILPVIILSNFPDVKLQFALNRSAYAFAQDVRKAQDMALASVEYKDSFGILQPVAGYGVYLDADRLGNKKYVIYADGMPGNNQYDALDYLFQTTDINLSEPGVIIKGVRNAFGGMTSINFASSNADVAITQLDKQARAVEVIFALENDPSKTKSVIINTSGLIEIK